MQANRQIYGECSSTTTSPPMPTPAGTPTPPSRPPPTPTPRPAATPTPTPAAAAAPRQAAAPRPAASAAASVAASAPTPAPSASRPAPFHAPRSTTASESGNLVLGKRQPKFTSRMKGYLIAGKATSYKKGPEKEKTDM